MHKVDSAGATAQNEFTNGDLPGGIARTRLEAKFMNAVQRELVALVATRGIALDQANDNQVVESIVLRCSSLTELRAFPVAGNTRPFTAHVAVGTDGYAMTYRWVNADTTTDNGLGVIQPASSPAAGRWIWTPPRNAYQASIADTATNAQAIGGIASASVLCYRAEIPAGANLNGYTSYGIYHQGSDAQAASGSNYPTALAGLLTVENGSGGGFIYQTYQVYATGARYLRNYYNGTWYTWRQFATIDYVASQIAALVNSSPSALDTLQELAAALGNDANFATTITNALAGKAPLNGTGANGTWGINISGTAASATNASNGTTQSVSTNNTTLATTAFVQALIAGGAGQSLSDVTASRAFDTTYTNSTGRPKLVWVHSVMQGTATQIANVNGLSVAGCSALGGNTRGFLFFVVPNGATYNVIQSVNFSALQVWSEL